MCDRGKVDREARALVLVAVVLEPEVSIEDTLTGQVPKQLEVSLFALERVIQGTAGDRNRFELASQQQLIWVLAEIVFFLRIVSAGSHRPESIKHVATIAAAGDRRSRRLRARARIRMIYHET